MEKPLIDPNAPDEEMVAELREKWAGERSTPVVTPVKKIVVRCAPGEAIRASGLVSLDDTEGAGE